MTTPILMVGILMLALVGVALVRPKQALLLAVLLTVFFPQGMIERDYIREMVMGVILAASILGVLSSAALHRIRAALPSGMDRRLYFVFLGVMLINMYISLNQDPEWLAYLTKVAGFWGFIIFVKLFYVIIANDDVYIKRILIAFAGSGAINILLILIAAYDNPGRATSLFDQTLMLPLPVIAGSVAFYNYLRVRSISLLWGSLLTIALMAVLFTGSRSLLLGMCVSVLIILVTRKAMLHGPKFLVLVPLLAAALWMGSEFFIRIFTPEAYDTAVVRYDEISAAWNAFLAKPLFGHGIGYHYISDSVELRLLEGTNYIHNMSFFVLSSFGLSGLAIVTAYSLYSIRLVMKHRNDSDLLLVIGAAGLGVLIYSLTQAVFFTLSYNLYMAFVMAVGIKAKYGVQKSVLVRVCSPTY
ncbi:MAG: O-antigen ligase family protein [Acidobacteria bacterium]|nr:O-antigen ligase family protein [Acidobacteriota bacterium]MBI3658201.1 O-antigen ligase family protein [Acidobacteriota bacterium]